MTEYTDVADLINNFNLTGQPLGTLTVPGISLDVDAQGQYIVTYTYFRNYADITSSSYYDANDVEPPHIVDGNDYRQDIETAIQSILNPTNLYSVAFSDVAKIDFQEATSGTGIITFGQMNGAFPVFSGANNNYIKMEKVA